MKPNAKENGAGALPEDWRLLQAREIGMFRGGNCFPLNAQGENSGAYPFFKVSDMNNEGNETVMTVSNHRISEDTRKRLGATVFPAGSIVFAKVGAAIFLERKKVLGQPSCIDNNMTAFVLNKELADVRFIHSQLLSTKLGALVSTTALPSLNGKQLGEMRLAVPPLPEQRAIAEALGNVTELLAALDQLIAKKRNLKQAAAQQLLSGKTRLTGFSSPWEHVCVGELFSFKNGLNKAKEFFGFGTPIVNYMDVFGNAGIFCSKLEGRVSLNQEIANFDVRKGDVLFTRTSETPEEIGMASVILDDPKQTVFSGFVLRGRPKNDRLHNLFKAYCFRSSFVRKQIISKASYTTRALTNGRILSAVVLPVPPLPEQVAIAEVLSVMDTELKALEQRREKTQSIKRGMMQELLTGRSRLI